MVRKCSIELAQTGADWRLKAPVCASAQVRKCSFKSTALAQAQWRPAERYPEGTSLADMLWRSPGFTNKSLQRRLASSTVADRRTAAPPAYLFDAVRFCGGVCRVATAFATTRARLAPRCCDFRGAWAGRGVPPPTGVVLRFQVPPPTGVVLRFQIARRATPELPTIGQQEQKRRCLLEWPVPAPAAAVDSFWGSGRGPWAGF
jgi:hypothetical protein